MGGEIKAVIAAMDYKIDKELFLKRMEEKR